MRLPIETPPSAEPSAPNTESGPEALPLVERVARLASRVSSKPEAQMPAISKAIDEDMHIIESLKRTVEQMEEVLELVELAERQKIADEREIDVLRRQLHRLHQPRERRGAEHQHEREQREEQH
jgi:hypothetical protein